MKLEDLLKTPGERVMADGPSSKIVLSSRVRLARNLRGYPFPGWAKKPDRVRTSDLLRPAVQALPQMENAFSQTMEGLIA